MEKISQMPFYVKVSLTFIGLYALVSVLYIAQNIIVPFIFSMMIAIVLHPVVQFLVRKKFNRIIAIVIALIITIIIIAIFGTFLISQAGLFGDSWPKLEVRFTAIFHEFINWTSLSFNINPDKINAWFIKAKGELLNTSSLIIGKTIINVGSGAVVLFLIPVYVFMILFYEPLLLEFFRRLFGKGNRWVVSNIISQIKTMIQHYLIGLIIEAVIVATLNSVGLLILGVDYAILLGIIGALLNVIPYIGGIVAVALPMAISLVTKTSLWYPVYVVIVYTVVQFIDNYYLVPKIVASRVKINALMSVIVILIFGALWGIPGMFLSIPLTAILKVVFDHIEPLKPWGYLLGNDMELPKIRLITTLKKHLDKTLKKKTTTT